MDNHTYNLVETLAKKGKAVWAYDMYAKDDKDCPECTELWKQLKEEDTKMIEKIKQTLTAHIKSGKVA